MSTRAKGRSSSRKVSGSSYMDNDQFASYLAELRNNRVARPGGARPLPSSNRQPGTNSNRMSAGTTSLASSAVSDASSQQAAHQQAAHQQSQPDVPAGANKPLPPPLSFSRKPSYGSSFVGSVSSRYSTVTGHGRDYYPDKKVKQAPRPLRPGEVVGSDIYMESGQRWMEKEEAVSLRQAMEDLDIKKGYKPAPAEPVDEDDQRLYNAALNEAAELVYQHENGIKPPEPGAPYQYKQHLRKNSYAHARTASVGLYGNDIQPTGLARDPTYRSVSDSSASSTEAFGSRRSRYSYGSKRVASGASDASASSSNSNSSGVANVHRTTSQNTAAAAAAPDAAPTAARTKAYSGLAGGPRPMAPALFGSSKTSRTGHRRSSMKRNTSGEIERPFSGDQIYEEPETATPEKGKAPVGGSVLQPASKKRVASLGNAKAAPTAAVHAKSNSSDSTSASAVSKIVSRYEIHRNPPTQSRNPQYTTNATASPKNYIQEPHSSSSSSPAAAAADNIPRKNGVEIRGDDIRQATSFSLKDRNPKLPTPSYVSDNPGRPIVSFDADWKAPDDEAATDSKPDPRHQRPQPPTTNLPVTATPSSSPRPLPSSRHQESPHPVTPVAHPWSSTRQQQQQQQQQQQTPPPHQQQQFRQQYPPSNADAVPLPLRVGPRHAPAAVQVNQPTSSNTRPPSIPTIAVTGESAAPAPAPPPKATPPTTMARNRSPFARPMVPTISVSESPSSAPSPSPAPPVQKPPIPTIVLPGDDGEDDNMPAPSMPSIPIIVTPDDDHEPQQRSSHSGAPPIPIIVTPDETGAAPGAAAVSSVPRTKPATSSRPLPAPAAAATAPSASSSSSPSSRRPLPTPGNAMNRLRGHWSRAPHPPAPPSSVASTNSHNRATALCHECGQPIEGRFVALKGLRCAAGTGGGDGSPSSSGNAGNGTERFHPQCFRCYACGTSLEALEISPEPDQFREARLARIAARAAGEILEEKPGETMAEDGDERLRFYCHLDWHELFAPRCKHCTTPIVGEHVYALGAHWHVGHFFCAECGDPFPPGATHIEKDGYAWCVGCQTKRTERRAPKCRACGKAVIGAYVQALGAEWHDGCFRCAVCRGGFADGQVFPREGERGLMQVVCTGCRERELKA